MRNKNIIQKADKGSTVVKTDKEKYIKVQNVPSQISTNLFN